MDLSLQAPRSCKLCSAAAERLKKGRRAKPLPAATAPAAAALPDVDLVPSPVALVHGRLVAEGLGPIALSRGALSALLATLLSDTKLAAEVEALQLGWQFNLREALEEFAAAIEAAAASVAAGGGGGGGGAALSLPRLARLEAPCAFLSAGGAAALARVLGARATGLDELADLLGEVHNKYVYPSACCCCELLK